MHFFIFAMTFYKSKLKTVCQSQKQQLQLVATEASTLFFLLSDAQSAAAISSRVYCVSFDEYDDHPHWTTV